MVHRSTYQMAISLLLEESLEILGVREDRPFRSFGRPSPDSDHLMALKFRSTCPIMTSGGGIPTATSTPAARLSASCHRGGIWPFTESTLTARAPLSLLERSPLQPTSAIHPSCTASITFCSLMTTDGCGIPTFLARLQYGRRNTSSAVPGPMDASSYSPMVVLPSSADPASQQMRKISKMLSAPLAFGIPIPMTWLLDRARSSLVCTIQRH
mmetsp:Transcript_15656/g.33892  ORF Transcript_15656/g.33892 Transcript_15656/m.33892 type:complete len:212 (+) Transcript_15656:356-991(+)